MAKIEVGKLYRVNIPGHSEDGNIIRIVKAIGNGDSPRFRYEIVEGEKPTVCVTHFDRDSIHGRSLVPAREMIVIYRDDNKVVAVNKATGKEGVARCAPDDTFNFETGAKLAFKRLVGEDTADAAEPVKPEAPKFKVGEFVRVVSAKTGDTDKYHHFPIGQIVEIISVRPNNEYACNGVVKTSLGCAFSRQIVKADHIEKLEEA